MKKVLVNDFFDFLEKLEKIQSGEIKIEKLDVVIRNLLVEEGRAGMFSIYLIPNNPERILILLPSPVSKLFEFINTPSPFFVSYMSVEHVSRLFIYTKEIYILLEEEE